MAPFIILFLGIVSLILFFLYRDKNSSTLAICFKTSTSVSFIVLSMVSLISNANASNVLIPGLLFIFGLVMGLIGDITLDFKIYFKSNELLKDDFKKDKDRMMWIGMVSFAIGHISYITALSIVYPNSLSLLWLAALIGIGVISLVFFVATKLMKMNFGKFFIPCYGYGFLLSTFVVYSLIALINNSCTATILLFIGSILFIISDLILSMTYFSKEEDYKKEGILNPESKLMIQLNHLTYYAAQWLIALAILFI